VAGYNTNMSGQVATPKAQMIELLVNQPDDSSYDELLRELAFAQMVDRGLADSDAGRSVSHDAMKRTIESWRK
jgi:predicted transcriptional regulator